MRRDDKVEGLFIMKFCRDVAQDSSDFGVILWRIGERGVHGGDMMCQLAAEPGPCARVHSQIYSDLCDSQGLQWYRLEERKDAIGSAVILFVVSHAVVALSVILSLESLVSSSFVLIMMSYYDLLVEYYNPWCMILGGNVLRSCPVFASPSKTTPLVISGRRKTAYRVTQLRSFFKLERLPMAVWRSNLVVGRGIWSVAPEKS